MIKSLKCLRTMPALSSSVSSGKKGYTLLEICLALAVVAVVIGTAIPLTRGILVERRIEKVIDQISESARFARKRAMLEGRPMVIELGQEWIRVIPLVESKLNASAEIRKDPLREVRIPKAVEVEIREGNAEAWKPLHGQKWVFQPSGLSNPIEMRVKLERSWNQVYFDPLTARAHEVEAHVE